MSASVVSPCMFRSYTWPSSGDVPCTMLLSALLLRHYITWVCGRILYFCCCHVYFSAVGLVVYFQHSTQQDRQQRGTHDNNTGRRYGHIPKWNSDEATRRKAALYTEHPLKMVKYMTETCRVTQQTQIF